MQPISKFVQIANSYFTGNLPYQIINTKEFLQKADKINETYSPLPDAACFAVSDGVSLYPNVNNEMKFQLRKKKRLPKDNPNPKFPSRCVLEALDIGLHGNACQYTDGDGRTLFAKPNHGTAKDLCHTCDFVELTC